MRVGIDLGTTYSCIAYLDDAGVPQVIPNAEGALTTPSIVAFNGRLALVGKSANDQKLRAPLDHYEFIKRDIGKPVESTPALYNAADSSIFDTAPYEIDGFKYGAAGMSAIILRRLKRDAVHYFIDLGILGAGVDEREVKLEAVITVPAYFGDTARRETRLAGFAAGLDVVGVINEPTAAALAYGLSCDHHQRVMIFDLGGGTCDVTIMDIHNGGTDVLTSAGDNALGGKDWDGLIESYLRDAFYHATGHDVPDDLESVYIIRQAAVTAKLALSTADRTVVDVQLRNGRLSTVLYRVPPDTKASGIDMDQAMDMFFFEERATELLHRCRRLCKSAIEKLRVPTPVGDRPMEWSDLDTIVLSGGSCRMPMVAKMLEKVSGKRVERHVEGFNYDTAVAIGAAVYGQHSSRVQDVVSHSIGIELIKDGHRTVEPLIPKDSPLPIRQKRRYRGGANARIVVYEGESTSPDECTKLGHVGLENEAGDVDVSLDADVDGILVVTAHYPPDRWKTLTLRNELCMYEERAVPLRAKIQSIQITP